MSFRAKPFRRRAVTLTPLIDVIFLLLLFFMLSSTFSRFGEIEIAGASGGAASAQTHPVFMQLREDGLTVNGRPMEPVQAVAELKRLAGQGATSVILSVRERATSQQLVDAVTAIRAGTTLRLSVIH